ncbi:hypothetical protein QYE76_024983 [Lolium multiflorum]|uniref:Uncharacterized protein n=1 Tax=Lolium multiflorum TaxID=4521 RepID=A0AAD8REY2_LOLMU|nr:hypothetical protein QYE76_024983 [Lolium multiflorum]
MYLGLGLSLTKSFSSSDAAAVPTGHSTTVRPPPLSHADDRTTTFTSASPETASSRPLGGKRRTYGDPSSRWWAKKEYRRRETPHRVGVEVPAVEGRSGGSNTDQAGDLGRWPPIPPPAPCEGEEELP